MTDAHEAAAPAAGWTRWTAFAGLALVVLLADQLTKAWVDAAFPEAWIHAPRSGLAPPSEIVGDLVRIAKTYNDGGIFGLLGSGAPFLAVASVLVAAGIVVYQWRSGAQGPPALTVALGLLLGGALGNLIDRIRLGHVIDFVDLGVDGLRWYTFNVADASISIAVALLILLAVGGDRLAAVPGFRMPPARTPQPDAPAPRRNRFAAGSRATDPSGR
ncbi:MAG TPA: signal peptidase II [Candidatus Limnocylindrales bacterium]|nr:signal peptidase II [Candidatus Limnocylindrales bacterium]